MKEFFERSENKLIVWERDIDTIETFYKIIFEDDTLTKKQCSKKNVDDIYDAITGHKDNDKLKKIFEFLRKQINN